jgi:hypothetical protein
MDGFVGDWGCGWPGMLPPGACASAGNAASNAAAEHIKILLDIRLAIIISLLRLRARVRGMRGHALLQSHCDAS